MLLSVGPHGVGWPIWSPDSRYLVLETGTTVTRLRIADGHQDTVASLAGLHRATSHFGSWSGAAPDGSVLELRNAGVNEIFALPWEAR